MKPTRARARLDDSAISPEVIRNVVLSLFGRRHDYGDGSVSELVSELNRFGITTRKQFRLLMKKHRRVIREDEERKMPRPETLYLAKEFGWGGVDVHANKSWFAIPGLVRQALELEYGEEASVYVEQS